MDKLDVGQGAFAVVAVIMVIEKFITFFKWYSEKNENQNKQTEALRVQRYQDKMQANIEKTNEILEKLSEKQSQTKEQVKDIYRVQSSALDGQSKIHDKIEKIRASTDVTSQVLTKDTLKYIIKDAVKGFCKAKTA
jgi:hypothetical protein